MRENPDPKAVDAESLPHLINITEVAESLGVDPRHVRRLVHERRIPYIKWGHLIRFDPEEIATWLDRHRQPGPSAHPGRRPA